MQLIELNRSSITESRMLPLPVIEDFDVLEDLLFRLLPGLETAVMNQFRLERVEEPLGRRVIATVAFATHAADVALVLQQRLEPVGSVLAAAVSVHQQALSGIV